MNYALVLIAYRLGFMIEGLRLMAYDLGFRHAYCGFCLVAHDIWLMTYDLWLNAYDV